MVARRSELKGLLNIFLYKVREVSPPPPGRNRAPSTAQGTQARERLSNAAQTYAPNSPAVSLKTSAGWVSCILFR